jgi:hypothetical protein
MQDAYSINLASPSRFFLKDGPIVKICRGGRKKFHFALFNDLLIYGTEKLTIGGKKQYRLHRQLPLSECLLVTFGPTDMSFMIMSTSKSFVCQALTVDERTVWVTTISDAIQRLYLMGAIRKSESKLRNVRHVSVWILENSR